eukprot:CAMPEP_0194272512 /NCGR_PEP_ID=MMETSP0169-20130528/6074_1 /TAXON_ID=218684 /ORGANISM="Corethron pennatum, Strain L29A3" /LENGTH=256 /DNA_ID=CAMNT_0039015203 /DNA_START=476 /DNA_END=1243 /DNA_ORIENTATION=-
MALKDALGRAFMSLRELNQLIISFTEIAHQTSIPTEGSELWELTVRHLIIELLDNTVDVVKDNKKMMSLAYREDISAETFFDENCGNCGMSSIAECLGSTNDTDDDKKFKDAINYDPMIKMHGIKYQLFSDFGLGIYGKDPLQLFEKTKIIEKCHHYTIAYTEIMKFQSTPIPFPLLQMGRTFLLIYTFAMPLALIEFVPDFTLIPVMLFIFFLTYGYVGLELVAFRLLTPFGHNATDLDLDGMRKATIYGILCDW